MGFVVIEQIYMEVLKGIYCLLKATNQANNLLKQHLAPHGYVESNMPLVIGRVS